MNSSQHQNGCAWYTFYWLHKAIIAEAFPEENVSAQCTFYRHSLPIKYHMNIIDMSNCAVVHEKNQRVLLVVVVLPPSINDTLSP